ncbi:hypothetical protein Rhopal_006947-T1 [Rhodotorula paludigena]|uniref:RRM domain-containing protein n=1 Tax=Rhodotorula paludigena TaxID=86838 RepID=A0AAV5GUI7_9BASI|nr:hypothetical protein Rhopal_006947-T1 [Rhodotorula paludigena]
MLLEHDPAALKPWLTRSLEPISDAEPAVLADYVLALLKHDVRDVEELRQFCVQQLDDFLDKHTPRFVESLIAVVSEPSPPVALSTATAAVRPAAQSDGPAKRQRSSEPALAPAKQMRLPLQPTRGERDQSGDVVMNRAAPGPLSSGLCRDYHRKHSSPLKRRIACLGIEAVPLYQLSVPRPPPSRTHSSRPARGASRVISVENIPVPSLTDAAVRHFFAPFGQICDLYLDLERRAATVTFATPAQADRAVSSPQAVFGNRFVRVYRANDRGVQGSQDTDRTSPSSTDTSPFPAQAMSSPSTRAPHQAKSRSPDAGNFLRDNAAQQRHLLDEFEGADKERRRAILADLRRLAAEAESARASRQ